MLSNGPVTIGLSDSAKPMAGPATKTLLAVQGSTRAGAGLLALGELSVSASLSNKNALQTDSLTGIKPERNQTAEAKQDVQAAQAEAAGAQRMAQDAQARSALLEAQLSALSAKKTARGIVITLSDVLFGTDLARLNAEGMRSVQKLVALLQDNPQRTVLVEGFTDSTGSAAHNQALSERRASAVRSALVDLGVGQERVAIHGYGETLPVAANDSAANRQLNRRVEIVLSDDKGTITPR
jgi:outer membrane protein OmpA-like peptidoglycan-associated protein